MQSAHIHAVQQSHGVQQPVVVVVDVVVYVLFLLSTFSSALLYSTLFGSILTAVCKKLIPESEKKTPLRRTMCLPKGSALTS